MKYLIRVILAIVMSGAVLPVYATESTENIGGDIDGWYDFNIDILSISLPKEWQNWDRSEGEANLERLIQSVNPEISISEFQSSTTFDYVTLAGLAVPQTSSAGFVRAEVFVAPFSATPDEIFASLESVNNPLQNDPTLYHWEPIRYFDSQGRTAAYIFIILPETTRLMILYPIPEEHIVAAIWLIAPTQNWTRNYETYSRIGSSLILIGEHREESSNFLERPILLWGNEKRA